MSASPHERSHWRWPSICAVCRGFGSGRVCNTCIARFVPQPARCERCALRVPDGVAVCASCLKHPPAFDDAIAAVDYDHPWDVLIGQFKFNAALDLTAALAELMARACGSSRHTAPDLLLPVPLGTQRLVERGYNQAWELARNVSNTLGLKADAGLLLRVKETPHQAALPLGQRVRNVHRAFTVEPLRLAEVRGRHLALIDDVMTTGATLAACAEALREAGASHISAWVLARTPDPND